MKKIKMPANVPVATGAVTQANMKISAVDGTAFIDLTATTMTDATPVASGTLTAAKQRIDYTTANAFAALYAADGTTAIDLTAYQTGNYKIRFQDSAGKVAEGWISDTAPGGETLDGTLVVNGVDFTGGPPPTGWNEGLQGTVTESGGKLKVTKVAAGYFAASQGIAQTSGRLGKFMCDLKTNTADQPGDLRLGSYSTPTGIMINYYRDEALAVSDNKTVYITEDTTTYLVIGLVGYDSVGGDYLEWDNIRYYPVTDCAATGALILSTKGGSRGWVQLDSGFNPNLALTYQIFSANPLPLKLGNLLIVKDSTGRKIQGFIKAAGTGETYTDVMGGTDPTLLNGDFSAITKATAKSVVGITKANPGVVTFGAGHGYANGDVVYFSGLTQMTELNTQYWQLRANSGDTFQLATVYDTTSLNTSGYGGAETTGGNCAQKCTYTGVSLAIGWFVGVDGAGALTSKLTAIAASGTTTLASLTPIVGVEKLYKGQFTISSYISGSTAISLYADPIYLQSNDGVKTFYINRVGTTHTLYQTGGTTGGGTAPTLKVGNATIQIVLTPSATGVTIAATKTLAGTPAGAESFAQKDASFNYNDASGYTYEIYKVLDAPVVASGNIAAGAGKIDYTATNAFAEFGVDLSAYQDGKHILALYNTTGGYAAIGYISDTAPGGETLGDELLVDPPFDVTGSWLKGSAAWTVSGGKANAANALAGEWIYQEKTLVAGTLYKIVGSCDSLTSGTYYLTLDNISTSGATIYTSTGTKTQYLTVTTGGVGRICGIRPATNLTATFTDLSEKPVLAPSTTGALILSTKGGATRSWMYRHASFNPNLAMSYAVLYCGD